MSNYVIIPTNSVVTSAFKLPWHADSIHYFPLLSKSIQYVDMAAIWWGSIQRTSVILILKQIKCILL